MMDQLYLGMAERGGKMPERIGAFAALLDYRDGTNYTGLNPENKKYMRHIGVTGHLSSPVLMEMLRRDTENNLDTLLVALNANDKLYTSHEYNVLQLAVGRGMGVIAMKLFGDGSFYGKDPHFSRTTADVIYSVGKAEKAKYQDLVRYSLSIPGVSCAVTGIGHIDREKPENDQLVANLAAATQDPASPAERRRIEREVAGIYGATTNYFQLAQIGTGAADGGEGGEGRTAATRCGALEYGDCGGAADCELRDSQRGQGAAVGSIPAAVDAGVAVGERAGCGGGRRDGDGGGERGIRRRGSGFQPPGLSLPIWVREHPTLFREERERMGQPRRTKLRNDKKFGSQGRILGVFCLCVPMRHA